MGFSFVGTLIEIFILLPSIFFFIKFPPKNIPNDLTEAGFIYRILEKIGQISCLTVLVISKDNFQNIRVNIWALLMMFCILVYYFLWIRYVVKGQAYNWLWTPLLFIPIPLAIFPVCAFGFAALWGKSIWLGIAVIVLAIGHITVSWNSYKYAISTLGHTKGHISYIVNGKKAQVLIAGDVCISKKGFELGVETGKYSGNIEEGREV